MSREQKLIEYLQEQVKHLKTVRNQWMKYAAQEREKREALEETLRDLKAAYRENPRD